MEILIAMIKSFTPPEAYERAAFEWKWKAVAYFFALTAICAAATTAMSVKSVSEFYDGFIGVNAERMGSVEISKDGVKTPDGKPVEFKSKSGKLLAIATPERLDAAQVKGLVFSVEKDRFSFYGGNIEQTVPLETLLQGGQSVKLSEIFPTKSAMVYIILPCVFFAVSGAMNLTYCLAMGLAGKTLAIAVLPSLGYLKCVKIALVAITPPCIIDLGLMAFVGVPMPGLVFAAISGGLVWISIRAIATKASDGKLS